LLHRLLLSPQTVFRKVETPSALPTNAVLVKLPTRPVWVWIVRHVGIGQPTVTQFTAALDTIEDEGTKDDECEATKTANDTDNCVRP
jgi:hypothetical protein